ncbi:MAG: ABC-2 family transporter protein, partial [Candidatus Limnocylindrales bacterium]
TESRRLLGIYGAKFRTELALQLAYRGALVIWLLGLLLEPIVYLVVWTTVARAQGGSVGGFTAGDFAAYFTVLMVVNQLTFTWHFHFFEWRVRNGFFSPILLRPVHPIHNDVAENLTFKALTFTVVAPVALFVLVSFGASSDTQPWNLLALVPALLLAMGLRFAIEWTLALAAFWITRTAALNQAYYVAILFLSGQVAPLSLFPPAVQTVASVLPFRWMVAFPVETALGRLSPTEVLTGYAIQAAWILVALAVLRVAWRAGVRRYSAVGA